MSESSLKLITNNSTFHLFSSWIKYKDSCFLEIFNKSFEDLDPSDLKNIWNIFTP